MLVTLLISKASGWSKASASINMLIVLATELVSKVTSWLNESAASNMELMSVTLVVSNTLGIWLKTRAAFNMDQSSEGALGLWGQFHATRGTFIQAPLWYAKGVESGR